jgi:hypothetical protein
MPAIKAEELSVLLKACFGIDIDKAHPRLTIKVLNSIDESVQSDLEKIPLVVRRWISAPACNDQNNAAAFGKHLSACLSTLGVVSANKDAGVTTVAKAGAFLISCTGMSVGNAEVELRDRRPLLKDLADIFDALTSNNISDNARELLKRWGKGVNESNNVAADKRSAKFIGALGTKASGDADRRTKKYCKILMAIEAAQTEAKKPGDAFDGCTPGLSPLHRTIDDTNIEAVSELWKVAKPGSVFAGFARWGKANYGSVAESELGHFRKHVLRAPLHGAPDDDEEEHQKWWTLLGIKLDLDTVSKALADAGMGRKLTGPETNWFDAGKLLKMSCVKDFVKSDILAKSPSLIDTLAKAYSAAFTRIGLDATKSAKVVYAFASREFAMVGCFTDTMFVVGRMDDGVLAMSSCYIPVNVLEKKKSSSQDLLWLLKTA